MEVRLHLHAKHAQHHHLLHALCWELKVQLVSAWVYVLLCGVQRE
jgi:hypothetical protein